MEKPDGENGIVLTEEQKRRRPLRFLPPVSSYFGGTFIGTETPKI